MKITDFALDANTIDQQVADVRAYAAENTKRYGWDLIKAYSDDEIAAAIGTRKNSRAAIMAAYAVVKPLDDFRKAESIEYPEPVPATDEALVSRETQEVLGIDKAAERRERRRLSQKSRRAAKRSA